jgi:DHA3 family macrolide efflux protein-like MFS transporter
VARGPFLRLWIAQTVSLFGDFIAAFAVQVAVVFRMHGSAQDATGVLLASLAPSIVLGPVAGVFADRWDPRRTMIVSDVARGVLILLLAFVTTLPQLYALCFLVSCFSSFFAPAQSITIPLLVKREDLLAASARMQQTMQLARIVSPAAAGAIAAGLGESACYYADSLSFFFSAAMLATLSYRRPATVQPRRARAIGTELVQGLRFLFTNPTLSFVTISWAAGTFAAGCFGALASVYVRDVLRAHASVLGMIGSMIGLGTLAGSAVVARLARGREAARGRNAAPLIGIGMLAVGAAILLLAMFPNRMVALAGAAGIGLGVAVVMVAATAMLQGETPAEMRGRVSSGSASVMSMAYGAAIIVSGGWAARVGALPVLFLSATLLFVTGLCGIWRCKRAE